MSLRTGSFGTGRAPGWLRQHVAALRLLILFTIVVGVAYPLLVAGIGQIPGLHDKAEGSLVKNAHGQVVGSSLIGQSFTDAQGNPIPKYFQSRPSAATANVPTGYDPTATSASNLGPESVTDTLPNPADKTDTGTQSLLTQVCTRSLAVGKLEHVSGARPYCTPSGVGAVLAVFYSQPGYKGSITKVISVNEACPAKPFLSTYLGVPVQCGRYGEDTGTAKTVAVRGNAPAHPAVPSDAVTASGSGLDPDISPAYARLQVARVAAARDLPVPEITHLVDIHVDGRALGFMGAPSVNVLDLNRALDQLTS